MAMAPKLSEVFGFDGRWNEILEQRLELPANLKQLLLETWQRDSARALSHGMELSPQRFAEMFVDANFPAKRT